MCIRDSSYTGSLTNSVKAKEDELLSPDIFDKMVNGIQHKIPVSTSFNLFNYINVSPSFNYNAVWLFREAVSYTHLRMVGLVAGRIFAGADVDGVVRHLLHVVAQQKAFALLRRHALDFRLARFEVVEDLSLIHIRCV